MDITSLPYDDAEKFLSHSALFYNLSPVKLSRARFVKKLVQRSKTLRKNQCPKVAEFCRAIRTNGDNGVWMYDQYCQMVLGARPSPDCFPLSLTIVEIYANDMYEDPEERQRFIDMRREQCLGYSEELTDA